MSGRSEQSDDDMLAAKVLTHIREGTPYLPEPKPAKTVQSKEDDKENFSEQSSLAEDDEKDLILETQQEDFNILMQPDTPSVSYAMPFFTKSSGEVVLQLTNLYSPLPSTQAYYDKCSLIKRVCKTSASQSDYHSYARSLREYKAQLMEFYSSVHLEQDFSQVSDSLLVSKRDYEKKVLFKRLKELDCMIQELETYTPSVDSPTSLPSNVFYNIKNSDFTSRVV